MLACTVLFSGCVLTSKVDLKKAADGAGLTNITTGDGTFADYKATGFHAATEIGLGVGVFNSAIIQLVPNKTDEDLLIEIAKDAKNGGADAMINVNPASKKFIAIFPIPLVAGIGLYVDEANGTGIDVK